jgi:C-3',4' desaturase CrtD
VVGLGLEGELRGDLRVVVIGGGVGGLVVAGCLARAGLDVTLLESHIYVGGCAGTFLHKGYRFDAGATLTAGFYPGGPFDLVARRVGVVWNPRPADVAMLYHDPNGLVVSRPTCHDAWRDVRLAAFGADGERFWRWQEETADALWPLALARPAWPPSRAPDLIDIGRAGLRALPRKPSALASLAADAFRPVAPRLAGQREDLRLFVDAQLLISSQATSERASALHGAAALDLPRRGVVHLERGMAGLVEPIADASRAHGGKVLLRREATRIAFRGARPVAVETRQGERYPADVVVVNLPAPDARRLAGDAAPPALAAASARPRAGWGAFVAYVGVDASALPPDLPLHHQVVVGRPLGEGRSVFLSLSLPDDPSRAPKGLRAATLSTHTRLEPWWDRYRMGRAALESWNAEYSERLIAAVAQAIPGFQTMVRFVLPGSPVDFERFTHRTDGWVGGYPQTSLLRSVRPRVGPGLWLVGDSVFPGQSTPAVALGGLRVADQILRQEVW